MAAVAVVGAEVGPVCCYSKLRRGGGKRGGGGTPLLVTALVCAGVWLVRSS